MPTAQEVIEQYGLTDEDLEALREEFGPAALRKELGEAKATIKELKPKAENWEKQERLPDVQAKVEKAGGDWDALSPLEQDAVVKFDKIDDEEALAKFISDNRLATKGEGGESEEPPAAGQIADQAERASRDAGRSKTTISAADVKDWPADKIAKFRDDHPDLHEQILQGKEVVATFS